MIVQCAEGSDRDAQLPFAHLNLRGNPFGELDIDQRADLAVVDVSHLVERLRQSDCALQFLGDKGHGKTTHLLALRQHFPAAAYIHVGEGQRPRLPHGNPLFIDELQRVSRIARWRAFRRHVPLVLGTHRDFTRELHAAGRTVETIRPAEDLSPQRLMRILNLRVEHARRGPGPVPEITSETVDEMMNRFGCDVRAVEEALYMKIQTLTEITDV